VNVDLDLLGIGVRLGIYFQLSSNILLLRAQPEEAASSVTVSSLFMSAYFISLLYSIANSNIPPGGIICSTGFLFLDIGALNPTSLLTQTTFLEGLSFWTFLVIEIRQVFAAGFFVWFWYTGINAPQCREPRVFMFANCGAYGGVRVFFRILAIVGLIYVPYAIWKTAKDVVDRLSREGQTREERWTVTKQEIIEQSWGLKIIVSMNENVPSGFQNWVFMVVSIMIMFFFILFIELEIKWNHFNNLGGITSTGQIFPFIVGLFSFVRALFNLAMLE